MTVKEIGLRIRVVRETRGLTQEAFAKMVGITRVSLTRYEIGERTPNAVTIAAICEVTGISADYLLGLIGHVDCKTTDVSERTGLSASLTKSAIY